MEQILWISPCNTFSIIMIRLRGVNRNFTTLASIHVHVDFNGEWLRNEFVPTEQCLAVVKLPQIKPLSEPAFINSMFAYDALLLEIHSITGMCSFLHKTMVLSTGPWPSLHDVCHVWEEKCKSHVGQARSPPVWTHLQMHTCYWLRATTWKTL